MNKIFLMLRNSYVIMLNDSLNCVHELGTTTLS